MSENTQFFNSLSGRVIRSYRLVSLVQPMIAPQMVGDFPQDSECHLWNNASRANLDSEYDGARHFRSYHDWEREVG